MSSKSTIYLLGDAILDNFHCLSDKERDLKKELSDMGYEVVNYAIDEMKVSDIINGIIPNEIFKTARSYPYPIEKDNKMYALQALSKRINKNKSFTSVYDGVGIKPIGKEQASDNMVVISMGGNNVRSNVMGILLGTDYFINSIITKEFIADYEKIIETVRSSCEKIVLVSIYLPYLGQGSSYGIYSGLAKPAMDKWHEFLNKMAIKYNIPVLDLDKSFNTSDRSHYGTIDSRPSNKSNKCIADCISYIYSHYDGYHVYSAPGLDYSKIMVE